MLLHPNLVFIRWPLHACQNTLYPRVSTIAPLSCTGESDYFSTHPLSLSYARQCFCTLSSHLSHCLSPCLVDRFGRNKTEKKLKKHSSPCRFLFNVFTLVCPCARVVLSVFFAFSFSLSLSRSLDVLCHVDVRGWNRSSEIEYNNTKQLKGLSWKTWRPFYSTRSVYWTTKDTVLASVAILLSFSLQSLVVRFPPTVSHSFFSFHSRLPLPLLQCRCSRWRRSLFLSYLPVSSSLFFIHFLIPIYCVYLCSCFLRSLQLFLCPSPSPLLFFFLLLSTRDPI